MARGKKEPPIPWSVRYFKRHRSDDAAERVPAQEFIESCPPGVKGTIFAVLKAVAEAPPPQFSGGGMWQVMHGSMKGYYEVRVMGPGKMLHRVFCILERSMEGLGFDNHSVVALDGMSKPNETAFSEADYAAVRRLGDEFRARKPRSVV